MGVQQCTVTEEVGDIEKYNTDAVVMTTHVHHLLGFAFAFSPGRVRLRTKQHSMA